MAFWRRRDAGTALPDDWRDVLDEHFWLWALLDQAEQDALGELSARLASEKRWEAANGFTLDPEMVLLMAAQASVLVLGLGFDYFSEVGTIIVHPTTVVMTGARGSPVPGLMTDAPEAIDGEAVEGGPLLLAWDAVLHDLEHHGHGYNVVFHEFAHYLDHEWDGAPWVAGSDARRRWIQMLDTELERLRAQAEAGEPTFLDPYAAEDRGEFFAVASEAFFEEPELLARELPALYRALRDAYRLDPAAW